MKLDELSIRNGGKTLFSIFAGKQGCGNVGFYEMVL